MLSWKLDFLVGTNVSTISTIFAEDPAGDLLNIWEMGESLSHKVTTYFCFNMRSENWGAVQKIKLLVRYK